LEDRIAREETREERWRGEARPLDRIYTPPSWHWRCACRRDGWGAAEALELQSCRGCRASCARQRQARTSPLRAAAAARCTCGGGTGRAGGIGEVFSLAAVGSLARWCAPGVAGGIQRGRGRGRGQRRLRAAVVRPGHRDDRPRRRLLQAPSGVFHGARRAAGRAGRRRRRELLRLALSSTSSDMTSWRRHGVHSATCARWWWRRANSCTRTRAPGGGEAGPTSRRSSTAWPSDPGRPLDHVRCGALGAGGHVIRRCATRRQDDPATGATAAQC